MKCGLFPFSPQMPVYMFEAVMFPTFLITWAITFPTGSGGAPSQYEWRIQDNLPFILYSVLGGLAGVSRDS